MVLRLAEELLLRSQALLIALNGALTPREQLLFPLGFCRARNWNHKGRPLHFASVKGTSSHVSNIAALEVFHRDSVLLTFLLQF